MSTSSNVPLSSTPPFPYLPLTYPPTINDVQRHVEELQQHVVSEENTIATDTKVQDTGMLAVKTANVWIKEASQKPPLRKLLGSLWLEGEICILFADTNVGKSILAVQIGNAVSKQNHCLIFPSTQVKECKVLYIDFELSDRQFYSRYKDDTIRTIHSFSDNFFRAEINPDTTEADGTSLEEQINVAIEKSIYATGANIVIIDNITYLSTDSEKAKGALPLMKHLKRLKDVLGLSILVLAHTPKRDNSKPIVKNDLQGSRMLMNFCDSSFAIGESQKDKRLRYIKQVKGGRSDDEGIVFDAENVLLCEIKKENAFLQFVFIDYVSENEHLKTFSEKEKTERKELVLQLHQQGKSQREISQEVAIPLTTVNRYINNANRTTEPSDN